MQYAADLFMSRKLHQLNERHVSAHKQHQQTQGTANASPELSMAGRRCDTKPYCSASWFLPQGVGLMRCEFQHMGTMVLCSSSRDTTGLRGTIYDYDCQTCWLCYAVMCVTMV
jgi:hypothetical protein